MVFNDRLKRAFFALFKSAVPRLDYFARYSGKVVNQPKPGLVDLVPDDQRIPSMGSIPVRQGIRGLTQDVPPGSTIMIGWENGDPSRPFCDSWAGGETDTIRITLVAQTIELGGEGSEPTLKGQTYRTAEAQMNTQLASTLTAMAASCTGPLSALQAGFTALATAVQAFEGQAATYPTTKVKVV